MTGCRLSVLSQSGRQTEPKQTEPKANALRSRRFNLATASADDVDDSVDSSTGGEADDVDPDDVAGDVSGADDVATVAGRRRR